MDKNMHYESTNLFILFKEKLKSNFLYLWMGLVVEKYESKIQEAILFC